MILRYPQKYVRPPVSTLPYSTHSVLFWVCVVGFLVATGLKPRQVLTLTFLHCVNLNVLFSLLLKVLSCIQYTERIQWPKQNDVTDQVPGVGIAPVLMGREEEGLCNPQDCITYKSGYTKLVNN